MLVPSKRAGLIVVRRVANRFAKIYENTRDGGVSVARISDSASSVVNQILFVAHICVDDAGRGRGKNRAIMELADGPGDRWPRAIGAGGKSGHRRRRLARAGDEDLGASALG